MIFLPEQKWCCLHPNQANRCRRHTPTQSLFTTWCNCGGMSQPTSSSVEAAPKCRCGNGDMHLFTSHTKTNPNRKFWGCLKWMEGYGCGAFLWKYRVSIDRSTISDSVPSLRVDIRPDLQRLSTNLDRLKREIEMQNQLVQMEIEGKHKKRKVGC